MGRVPLDDARLVKEASRIEPSLLRTLHAIHLASAIGLGAALQAFVTYDRR